MVHTNIDFKYKRKDKIWTEYVILMEVLPNVSREEAFRDSNNSFNRFVAMEASSVFRCKTLMKIRILIWDLEQKR